MRDIQRDRITVESLLCENDEDIQDTSTAANVATVSASSNHLARHNENIATSPSRNPILPRFLSVTNRLVSMYGEPVDSNEETSPADRHLCEHVASTKVRTRDITTETRAQVIQLFKNKVTVKNIAVQLNLDYHAVYVLTRKFMEKGEDIAINPPKTKGRKHSTETLRQLVELHEQGAKQDEIARRLSVPLATIYAMVKKIETQGVEGLLNPKRRTIPMNAKLEVVRLQTLGKSIAEICRVTNLEKRTVREILKQSGGTSLKILTSNVTQPNRHFQNDLLSLAYADDTSPFAYSSTAGELNSTESQNDT
jgi:transposase